MDTKLNISTKTLDDITHEVVVWADSVSPGRQPKDAVVKLVSETSELLDAVVNHGRVEGELADCLILLVDLADMYGINLIQEASNKMQINRTRDWEAVNGVIRRKRNGHEPT